MNKKLEILYFVIILLSINTFNIRYVHIIRIIKYIITYIINIKYQLLLMLNIDYILLFEF